jgi:hypothetical protein
VRTIWGQFYTDNSIYQLQIHLSDNIFVSLTIFPQYIIRILRIIKLTLKIT